MASKVDIFNLALTTLGAATVLSPTENSKGARACLSVYDMIRKGELCTPPRWNFSIKLAELAPSATAPLFDRAYSYPLPADFLAMADLYPESNHSSRDWVIQNGQIYTNEGDVLRIRYVSDVQDVGSMHPLFVISFAMKIASAISDSITQSNSKIATAQERYEKAIADARKANAFDNVTAQMPEDDWITVRL